VEVAPSVIADDLGPVGQEMRNTSSMSAEPPMELTQNFHRHVENDYLFFNVLKSNVYILFRLIHITFERRGSIVVKTLWYKSDCRWFDPP
jgi:hypothetical protein